MKTKGQQPKKMNIKQLKGDQILVLKGKAMVCVKLVAWSISCKSNKLNTET